MGLELTTEQQELVKQIAQWYRGDRQWFSYSGAAGTGKTTVIQTAIEELGIDRYIACAYVGKAVTVLSRHGLPASTIHSLIYNVLWEPVVDEQGFPVYKEDGKQKMRISFVLKDKIANDPELIIVDEATMVNDDLCEDILSFGIKTIFIGDNNQLPPVFGVSSVMLRPNFTLTKIMRQAENDPIVYLSQRILARQHIQFGTYGLCRVVPYIYLDYNYSEYDIILVRMNSIRDEINTHIRRDILGYDSILPVIGDTLICRQNDWDRCVDGNIFLTTGMSGKVTDINRSLTQGNCMSINFQPDITDSEFYNVRLDTKYISLDYEARKQYGFSQYEKFEYGYCVTVHMSQGSEYERVLFIDQPFYNAEMLKKIRYTAFTRARTSLDVAGDVRFGVFA